MKNHPCPGENCCPVCYDERERRIFDLESKLRDVEQSNRMLRDDFAQMEARAKKAEARADVAEAELSVEDDMGVELDRLMEHARKVKGSRDVHSVCEVLDLIPRLHERVTELERQLSEARKQTERLLNIARGCHDYGGGYHYGYQAAIYHHGIQTVINALEAAVREDTLQTRVLESVGRDAARRKEEAK